MNESFHPAVQLMLARMATNPEEFRPQSHRWGSTLDSMLDAASPEERCALETKIHRFRMDALHEQIMSELLDGNQKSQGADTTMRTALLTYSAVSPPAGVGSALKAIFK